MLGQNKQIVNLHKDVIFELKKRMNDDMYQNKL